MASDSSKSTPASKYDVNSQIAALLEKYFTSPTSSTRPSAVFTSGPNKGLPVSALPPSVTPFRQRGNVQRTSKVSAETARARQQREARTQNPDRKPNQTPSQSPNRTPDQIDERRRRKENERIIRDQQARARGEAQVRRGTEAGPLSYSTEKRFAEEKPNPSEYYSTPRAIFDPVEAEKASRKFRETEEFRTVNAPQQNPSPSRNLGPSALSQALGRIEDQPSVYFSATPGPTPYDYFKAEENINLANIGRLSDVYSAIEQRKLAMEDIANTQAEYRRRDEERRRRIAELDADAYAKHMAAVRAGRNQASTIGQGLGLTQRMLSDTRFDPLASIGNLLGLETGVVSLGPVGYLDYTTGVPGIDALENPFRPRY